MRFLLNCLACLLALAAARPDSRSSLPILVHKDVGDLPPAFDARNKWPHCPIGAIYDVGSCHASGAYSVVSTIMDRYCIHKNQYFNISAEDLLTCCDKCREAGQKPCDGSFSFYEHWQYWNTTGIVTGSVYNSGSGCRPYQIKPCDHYEEGSLPLCNERYTGPVQTCTKQCEAGYKTSYSDDKHFGQKFYIIEPTMDKIKEEIMTNGPVQCGGMIVDESFYHYRSGVYRQKGTASRLISVKIIGWGRDPTEGEYWICNNFWNVEWGDQGTFKLGAEVTPYLIVYGGIP